MVSLLLVTTIILAILSAFGTARQRSVAPGALIGSGLLIAVLVMSLITIGAIALKYLGPRIGPVVYITDLVLTLVFAIWLGRRQWRRMTGGKD